MNFNYINKLFIFFILFLVCSCQTIENYKKTNSSDDFNVSYETEDLIDLFESKNNRDNLIDYYSNFKILNFKFQKKIPKKITINNFKSKYQTSNPLKIFIIDDMVYSVDSNANFKIYNFNTGKLDKSFKLLINDIEIEHQPTSFSLFNDNFIISFDNGLLLMIDKTGKIIWFTKFNKLLKTPVKIIDSNFILLFGDTIKSISSNNGKELWSISIQESEIYQSKGGLMHNFANLLYFVMPNSAFGEIDTLIGKKNISNLNTIKLNTSSNNSHDKIYVYDNYFIYFDDQRTLFTYDIFENNFVLDGFKINNVTSFDFYNNSIIVKKNQKLISYNILNGKIFWSIDLHKIIDKKAKIIKIKSYNSKLHVFFSNGKIISIDNNILSEVYDLKTKNINLLYFQNNHLLVSTENGKTTIF